MGVCRDEKGSFQLHHISIGFFSRYWATWRDQRFLEDHTDLIEAGPGKDIGKIKALDEFFSLERERRVKEV